MTTWNAKLDRRVKRRSHARPQATHDCARSSDAQVHPHRFRLGKIVDRCRAMLAAEAGIALTAPRQPHIGIAIGVDPHGAGAGAFGKALHTTHVAAPNAGGET